MAGGLALDAAVPRHGQALANVVVALCFVTVFAAARGPDRARLLLCVALATAGEAFLCFGWRLYEYRHQDLPAFVPLGHALIFLSGCRLAARAPRRTAAVVTLAAAAVVALLAVTGRDTAGPFWFGLFLACLALGRDRRLYGVMFVLALVVELAGTAVGSWRWFPSVPAVGLLQANPPFCAGVFYCVLDLLVLALGRLLPAPRSPPPRSVAAAGEVGR